jgi:two-component system OmpR family sensor kinase
MRNFRTRLILIHFTVILIILSCSGFGAYWMLSTVVHNQLDAALLAIAETEAARLAASSGQAGIVHDTTGNSAQLSFARIDRLVQIDDADGQVLARSANLGANHLPITPTLLTRLAARETVFESLDNFGDEPVRMISMPASADGKLTIIQVAGSLDDVRNVLDSASLLFMIMTLGLLAAVGVVGVSLTRKVFRAIDDVVHQAHRIDENNLSARLPHPGTQDEIGKLVDTLNDMLARIEHSFKVQRRFTADASHELRSPLSRMRTELEITLRRPRTDSEYVETLRSSLEEVGRLTVIVDELLTIARVEAGQERQPSEMIALHTILTSVIERLKPLADSHGLKILAQPFPAVFAKIAASSIDLFLTNLLDNAIKFTPAGGQIGVTLQVYPTGIVISVSDTGPGIRPEEQSQLFERFFRGAATKSGEIAGVGLGLALSQAIVRSLGGQIETENLASGGAVFRVRLPLPEHPFQQG